MLGARKVAISGGDKFRDDHSLAFDGTDDHIRIPSTTYDVDGSTHSFVFWCKRDTTNTWDVVLGKHDSGPESFVIFSNSTNTLTIEGDSSDDSATGAIENTAGVWYHFVVTCNSGTVQMYENGKAITMSDSTIGSNITLDSIGGSGTSNCLDGSISEVAFYNSVLSASQVATIYNGREPYNHKEGVASGNLTHWYRMGDGTLDTTRHFTSPVTEGGVLSDESQNSYLGTDLADAMMTDGVWTGWGSNEVDEDSGAIKITYKSHTNSSGAYTYLKDSKGLTSDLTIGKVYKVSYQAKVGSGSVTTNISESGGFNVTGNATTSTSFVDYAIYIVCTSETDHYFYVNNMSADQEMWYQNIKVQEVVGNTGVIVNMASNQFSGDTP